MTRLPLKLTEGAFQEMVMDLNHHSYIAQWQDNEQTIHPKGGTLMPAGNRRRGMLPHPCPECGLRREVCRLSQGTCATSVVPPPRRHL